MGCTSSTAVPNEDTSKLSKVSQYDEQSIKPSIIDPSTAMDETNVSVSSLKVEMTEVIHPESHPEPIQHEPLPSESSEDITTSQPVDEPAPADEPQPILESSIEPTVEPTMEPTVTAENSTVLPPETIEPEGPILPALKQGYINKEGQFMHNWNNRYFVLDNGDLSYYEKPLPTPPYGANKKGSVPTLKGKKVVPSGELTVKLTGGTARDILLKFDTEVSMNEWTAAIRSHIAYCNRSV